MKFSIFLSLILVCLHVHAGPVVIGNGAGGEENQYVALWFNRAEIFGRCQKSPELCGMNSDEQGLLQKIATAATQWQPFRFYSDADFSLQARGLVVADKVPFVAYSQGPGLVIFNQNRMYEDGNKFSYDRKLSLLSLIAAQQAGLTAPQADTVVKKLVAFWQQRWSKLDLGILAQPDLQVWVQNGDLPALLLFDDVGITDLVPPLKQQLQCTAGALRGLRISSPFWSSYTKSDTILKATFAGSVSVDCTSGVQTSPLNFEMELVFQQVNSLWQFQKPLLKVHVSSLN